MKLLIDLIWELFSEAVLFLFKSFFPVVIRSLIDQVSFVFGILGLLMKSLDFIPVFIVNTLYGTWPVELSEEQLIKYELELIGCLTRQGRYREALRKTNMVLESSSCCFDAILFKAWILGQGFNNKEAACLHLKKIMHIADRSEYHYQLASELHDKFNMSA